jgi:hypothetical protein
MKTSNKYDEIYRQKLKKVRIIQPTNYQGIIFNIETDDGLELNYSEPESNESIYY